MLTVNKAYIRVIALISLICIIVALLGVVPVNADEKKIRIGYFDSYGMFLDPNTSELQGYAYDYFEEIARYTGWEYEYISCTWGKGMEMLKNGEIDIFGPMQKTPEREISYSFTDMNFGYEYAALYTLEQNEIFYNDFEFFENMRVGIEYSSPYIDVMDEFCEKYSINITYVPTSGDRIVEDLRTDKYDVFLSGSLLDIKGTKVVEKVGAKPFYYAVTKGNDEILDGLNDALMQIQQNNLNFSTDLFEKYYGNKSISIPDFTKEETEILSGISEIDIGLSCVIAPLQYFDEDGNMTGMAIEIMDMMAEECGVKFNYSLVSENPDADIIVFSDPKNISGGAGRITDSFLEGPVVLIYENGKFKDDDVKVSVSSLTFTDLSPVVAKYPDFEIVQYQTSVEALDALKNGEVDMAIASLYIFDCLIKDGNMNNYIAVPTDLNFNLRMIVSDKLPDKMVAILNKAMNRIPDDKVDTAVFSSFTEYTKQNSTRSFIIENIFVILISIACIAIVFLVLILIILLVTKSKKKALKNIAYYDSITKLPSLLKFNIDIEERLKTAKPGEYTFLAFDIDKFSYINNLLGYEVGNKILIEIVKFLKNIIDKDTYVTREMSDIFLLCIKTKNLKHFYETDKELLKNLEPYLGSDYPLTFSVGTYVIDDLSEDISLMADKANCARKHDKQRYVNSYKEFNEEMQMELSKRRQIHMTMAQGLENEEFIPYLQAKTDLNNRKIRGAEVLVKWHTSNGEILQPGSFIPIFEANGFIQKLDLYMFEKACQIISEWENAKLEVIPRLSVNLSKKTVLSEGLVNSLLYYVSKYRINIKNIELELTETAFAEDMQGTVNVINHLKSVGFIVSLDDFGSGYSSFNMLKSIYVDVIKIDKEFLAHSLTNDRGNAIIKSIIDLSKILKIESVAEGVETDEQVSLLQGFGCDIAQGFYFSRPKELAAFNAEHFNI